MKYLLFITLLFNTAFAQKIIVNGQRHVSEPTSQYIRVNLYDSAAGNIGKYNTTGWNDWNINLQNSTTCAAYSTYLLYSNGDQSGVRMRWVNSSNACTVAGYNDNGSGYGASETTPNFVQAHFRSHPYTTTDNTQLQIIGLPDNATNGYKITILTSRSTATSRPCTYIANGVSSGSIEAQNNLSVEAVMDNVTPSGNAITVTLDYSNGFAFINAVIIEKK